MLEKQYLITHCSLKMKRQATTETHIHYKSMSHRIQLILRIQKQYLKLIFPLTLWELGSIQRSFSFFCFVVIPFQVLQLCNKIKKKKDNVLPGLDSQIHFKRYFSPSHRCSKTFIKFVIYFRMILIVKKLEVYFQTTFNICRVNRTCWTGKRFSL